MKPYIIILLLMSVPAGIFAQSGKTKIAGAYNLVRLQDMFNGRLTGEFPVTSKGSQMKIWTDRNYIFTGHFVEGNSAKDTYGGGTYTIDGNKYEEVVMYHSKKDYLDEVVDMKLEIRGDTLIFSYPVDSHGELLKKGYSHIYKYIPIR
jgi:hypothetical protein